MAQSFHEGLRETDYIPDQEPQSSNLTPPSEIAYPILVRRDTEEFGSERSTRFPKGREVAVYYPDRPKYYVSSLEAQELAKSRTLATGETVVELDRARDESDYIQ